MQVVGLRIMWILWSTSSLCLPLPRSNKEHTILKQRQRENQLGIGNRVVVAVPITAAAPKS